MQTKGGAEMSSSGNNCSSQENQKLGVICGGWCVLDFKGIGYDRTYWPSSFQMKKSTICLNVKKCFLLFLFFYWFHISFLCYLAHFSHTAQHLFCWRGGFILYTDLGRGHGLYAGLGGLDSSRIHVVFQCANWLLLHVTPLWIIHAVCVLDADNKFMTVTRRMYTIENEGKAVLYLVASLV